MPDTKTKKQLYLELNEGDKTSKLEIDEFSEDQQLAVIDGVFKFFDIDVNFKDMIETYHKAGHAYKEFYESASDHEFTETNEKEPMIPEPKKIPPKPQPPEEDEASLFEKGIKIKNGRRLYRCRYICPNVHCNKESNHYIREGTQRIKCYECDNSMMVRAATSKGFPNTDSHFNYYVGGKYMREEDRPRD